MTYLKTSTTGTGHNFDIYEYTKEDLTFELLSAPTTTGNINNVI